MSEERAKVVRNIAEDLNIAMYQLSGFADMLGDIIGKMPFQEEEESYSIECRAFCAWAQKKLDVLTTQLMIQTKESSKLVSVLEKEVFAS
mgnify:FL=1